MRRFIVELRRILLDLLKCSLEITRNVKFSQLLMASSNIIQRHIRKVLIHKMTLKKTSPEEHPSIVSEQLKAYKMGLSSLLTRRLSKPCLPLTIVIVHLLDSTRKIFEKGRQYQHQLFEGSQTFCKELLPTENVKITKNISRVQSESSEISIPIVTNHAHRNKTSTPPPIVVKEFSENNSKVSNPTLECEPDNTLNNYQQSMKEKLQRITAEVKNTKESMFLSTSAVIKRFYSTKIRQIDILNINSLIFRSFSTGSRFLAREQNVEERDILEISQDSRKNSLSMSDIGSRGEDSLGLVEEKIIDPLDEEERDEAGDIIYEDGVTQLEDSIGRLRQLLEARRESEAQGFTRSMSDPARAVKSLEYDDRVLRTFSVKKRDSVSASVDSDCAEEAFKTKEDRFANFIRCIVLSYKFSILSIKMCRNETRSLFPLQNGKRSAFLNQKIEFEKREMRLLKFKFTTIGVSKTLY